MLLAPLTVTAHLDAAEDAPVALPALLAHYEAALSRLGATVERFGEELHFSVALARPARIGFWEADLGLIAGGSLEVDPTPTGCRVRLRARPRAWFLTLAIAPWAVLVWALGWTTAPWRYLLAYGGFPFFILLWVLVWANLSAFLEDTNRAFAGARSPRGIHFPPCAP